MDEVMRTMRMLDKEDMSSDQIPESADKFSVYFHTSENLKYLKIIQVTTNSYFLSYFSYSVATFANQWGDRWKESAVL